MEQAKNLDIRHTLKLLVLLCYLMSLETTTEPKYCRPSQDQYEEGGVCFQCRPARWGESRHI
uniref:Putative ovule protein n=1 Tax=Solanum chacoense TaxID=4108 RepID=A0A0V0GX54_SOLCH